MKKTLKFTTIIALFSLITGCATNRAVVSLNDETISNPATGKLNWFMLMAFSVLNKPSLGSLIASRSYVIS